MARKRERIVALVIAVLFLVFSFGGTAVAIWQLFKDNKEAKTVNQQNDGTLKDSAKLEGTQMQDFTPIPKIDELQKIDLKAGDGTEVKPGDTVVVDYTGAVASTGIIFQSSLDTGKPVSFGLDGVIKGWTDGIPGMKVGGTRRLLIPAAQAYGSSSRPGIPANSDLVFDVTLHSVGQ